MDSIVWEVTLPSYLTKLIEQTYDEEIHTFEGSPEYLSELTDNQRRAVWQERADSDVEREY